MRLKILFIAVFSSLIFSSASAIPEPINKVSSIRPDGIFDIYTAYKHAHKLNKPIFYVVASANCSHCTAYLQNTIKPNFEQINRDFVFALSDLTKGDKVPSNVPFNGTTPSTYIISPNGTLMITPIEGNFDSRYLQLLLKKLYEAYASGK